MPSKVEEGMIFPSFIEPNPKILVLGTSSITRGQANSVSCGQKLSRGYWSYIFFKKSPFWHFHLFSMVLTKDVSKFFYNIIFLVINKHLQWLIILENQQKWLLCGFEFIPIIFLLPQTLFLPLLLHIWFFPPCN